ncbi:hypothetical protein F5146DRAFT_1006564 [Armillaria mellea]|nr:hypothetical protein F5146DRAFT_1006564 [Armillaria mellea]
MTWTKLSCSWSQLFALHQFKSKPTTSFKDNMTLSKISGCTVDMFTPFKVILEEGYTCDPEDDDDQHTEEHNWHLSKFQEILKLRPTFHDELCEGGPDLLKLVYAQMDTGCNSARTSDIHSIKEKILNWHTWSPAFPVLHCATEGGFNHQDTMAFEADNLCNLCFANGQMTNKEHTGFMCNNLLMSVHYTLSSQPIQSSNSNFDYKLFYHTIINLMESMPDDELKDLLDWWNEIFPDALHKAMHGYEGHLGAINMCPEEDTQSCWAQEEWCIQFESDEQPIKLSDEMLKLIGKHENKQKCVELMTALSFYYKDATMHTGYFDSLILFDAISCAFFYNKDAPELAFPEHFNPIPIPALAFIFTVIEHCLNEWSTGNYKTLIFNETEASLHYHEHHLSAMKEWTEISPDLTTVLQKAWYTKARDLAYEEMKAMAAALDEEPQAEGKAEKEMG